MSIKAVNKIILIALVILPLAFVQAEEDCEIVAEKARKLYEKGLFREAITQLRKCETKYVSVDERFEIYRQMARNYLELSETDSANFYAAQMLETKPNYLKYPDYETYSFLRLLNSYTITPLWEIGVVLGPMWAFPVVLESNNITNSTVTYIRGNSAFYGLSSRYSFSNKWVAEGGVRFQQYRIESYTNNVSGWDFIFLETQRYMSFPLYIEREWNGRKLDFSLAAGLEPSILNSSDLFISQTLQNSETSLESYVNAIEQRNKLNLNSNLRVGFRKTGGRVNFGLHYNFGYTLFPVLKGDYDYTLANVFYFEDRVSLILHQLQFSLYLPNKYRISKR